MILVKRMRMKHLDQVHAIENRAFAIPWSRNELLRELKHKHAYYLVALDDNGVNGVTTATDNTKENINNAEKVVGYAGLWHVVNEGHITNIAVDEPYRRRGVGSLLLEGLIRLARNKAMIGITLEVRRHNDAAQRLYRKYGFIMEGIRKEYYADTKEDALIMWKYFETALN